LRQTLILSATRAGNERLAPRRAGRGSGGLTLGCRSGARVPGALLPPDDRPFPVEYAAFPWTPLPARDGKEEVDFQGRFGSLFAQHRYKTALLERLRKVTWAFSINDMSVVALERNVLRVAGEMGQIVGVGIVVVILGSSGPHATKSRMRQAGVGRALHAGTGTVTDAVHITAKK